MKYTSSEILKMAQTYLVELGNNFDHYKIRKAVFDEEDELIRGQDKGKKSPLWTVVIDDMLFDTTDFLTISDDTGEPLYAQSKHGVSEIIKDADGKFKWKEE